jgi:putative protease
MEESRPGEYLPVYENERGTYIFNSKDLCMIEHIPEMVEAGIDSFKIEGRMKTALYVAAVARTYRKAIDDYFESEETYRSHMEWYRAEISKCTYRQFTTGFYFGKPDENTQIYDSNTYVNEYIYLGIVEEAVQRAGELPEGIAEVTCVKIEQRNKFCVGDEIEIMKKDGRNVPVKVLSLTTQEGEAVESAPHPKQVLYAELSGNAEKYDLLRVRKEYTSREEER